MSDKVSDERLREILAGCEGVTPGPWVNIASIDVKTEFLRCEVREIDRDPTDKHSWPFRVCQTVAGQYANADRANFDHIARLDPATVAGIITELLALRAQQQAAGWRVKPLEWVDVGGGDWHAQSILGLYQIWRSAAGRYKVASATCGQSWGTLDEAKAAAQSDYAARINSAIEPAPVPDGYVMVPVEPTLAMMKAAMGWREYDCPDQFIGARQHYGAYRAMLAARPISGGWRQRSSQHSTMLTQQSARQ